MPNAHPSPPTDKSKRIDPLLAAPPDAFRRLAWLLVGLALSFGVLAIGVVGGLGVMAGAFGQSGVALLEWCAAIAVTTTAYGLLVFRIYGSLDQYWKHVGSSRVRRLRTKRSRQRAAEPNGTLLLTFFGSSVVLILSAYLDVDALVRGDADPVFALIFYMFSGLFGFFAGGYATHGVLERTFREAYRT